MFRKAITSTAVALALVTMGMQAHAAGAITNKGNFGISGWLVYWNPKSLQDFEQHAAMIDRVYPEWYIVDKNGMPYGQQFNVNDPSETQIFLANKKKTIEIAHANGIQIFSMIVNYDRSMGMHDGGRIELFLQDPALQKKHIQVLVSNALNDGADGIDIDYENLKAADAADFSSFMAQLKRECDKHGLLLAAAVAAKTSAAGTWDGNQCHDYQTLQPSLDLIQPMTYDEHWPSGDAGPVSSPNFTESVERYATSVIDPSKVELGLAGYGYDWKGKQGVTLDDTAFMALLQKFQVHPQRDSVTKEITFRYQDGADQHEVWFCDAGSYRPKYDIIRRYHLRGLALWYFGSEDPRFWDDVKNFKYAKNWH